MQFATNFLGHFALTTGLHDALAEAHGARIVSVSSSGHQLSPVVFDDLHFDFRAYDPFAAYGQSKTADALLTVEATRRWSGEGIYANALNPGAIATGLQQHTGGLRTPKERQKTVQQGAATSVLLAASPLLDKGRRPLFRGLQRGTRRHPAPRRLRRRRLVRRRPGQCRAAVGRRT
jgi:NAD(P)-dependent dehydrogenase (short-subunit alcohol dehydrogenase family)